MINPLDDADKSVEADPAVRQVQVGRSMFINVNEPGSQMVKTGSSNLQVAQDLKNKIDQCLIDAQKKPSIRK